MPAAGIKRLAGVADVTPQLLALLRRHLLPRLATLAAFLAQLLALFGRHVAHRTALHLSVATISTIPNTRRRGRRYALRLRGSGKQQGNGKDGQTFHARILGRRNTAPQAAL
jgi:hypothetical protein